MNLPFQQLTCHAFQKSSHYYLVGFCLCSSLTNLMSHFFVKIHRIWFMLLPSNKRPSEEQDQNFDDFFLYYYLLFYWHQFSWTPFVLDSPNFTSSHCDLGLSNDSRAIIPSKTLSLSSLFLSVVLVIEDFKREFFVLTSLKLWRESWAWGLGFFNLGEWREFSTKFLVLEKERNYWRFPNAIYGQQQAL